MPSNDEAAPGAKAARISILDIDVASPGTIMINRSIAKIVYYMDRERHVDGIYNTDFYSLIRFSANYHPK